MAVRLRLFLLSFARSQSCLIVLVAVNEVGDAAWLGVERAAESGAE